jgi:heme-degrading monooxygenase HmoA
VVGVFVTLTYGDDFDGAKLASIAEGARSMFEGMPGLRSKAFTIDKDGRTATNFYIWESRQAAEAFFTDDLVERVTSLYGVHPTVRFAEIATLVDNK